MSGGLTYPKSGAIFLLGEIQRLSGNVCDMVNELVARDQTIAKLHQEIGELRGQLAEAQKPPAKPAGKKKAG